MATTTKKPVKGKTKGTVVGEIVPVFRSREGRVAGKALRDTVPRASHAGWKPLAKRRDPTDVLQSPTGVACPN